jgi:hypothetical protein
MAANGYLAIVAYRSLVVGVPTGSLDIQARWFAESDPDEVRRLIREDPYSSYQNSDGETVCWELVEVLSVEPFAPSASGEEVAGFIIEKDELADMAS